MATKDAVAYLRVSGCGKIQGGSLYQQRETIHRYASNNDLKIVAEFKDKSISSTEDLKYRQGLVALLSYVEYNSVWIVIVERADCLARDPVIREVMLGQFRDLLVQVIAADSGVELTSSKVDSSLKLIRRVLNTVTKFEKSILVLKLRAARDRVKQQKGRCEGRRPFGFYTYEKKTLKRILQLYRKPRGKKRLGYYRIATILNKEGHLTRSGQPWIGPTVRGIVQRYKKRNTKKVLQI